MKLCKDCKYFKDDHYDGGTDDDYGRQECVSPRRNYRICLITGNKIYYNISAYKVREDISECGEEGRFFEPRENHDA